MGDEHLWVDDRCLACGLQRREVWLRDDAGHDTLGLVWSQGGRDVRVRPFPYLLLAQRPSAPTHTVDEDFPGLRIGPEPPCPAAHHHLGAGRREPGASGRPSAEAAGDLRSRR